MPVLPPPLPRSASQASSVRHTAGLIAKHGRLTGSTVASTTSTSDFNLALRASYGPSFDSTSGDALDRVEGVFDGTNFPIDRQGKKYVESLNLMSLENREDSNATTERELKSKEGNTNGDSSGNGSDASNLRNQEVQSSVQTIFNSLCDGSQSRRGSHGSIYDSAGTSSNAKMGKLVDIASSAEMLAEKISSTKNRRAFNTSIVIGDRSQAPYDFMSGSEDLSDEMRFERRPDKPKVSSALYEYHGEAAEGSNAYSFDSESFRDAYSGRGYSSTDSDVGEENWGPMMPRRYKQQDSAGERDLEIKSHGRNNFEDCNLRLSMDNASEQAIGLSVAAAKYGIF